jgi:hypothetical protein
MSLLIRYPQGSDVLLILFSSVAVLSEAYLLSLIDAEHVCNRLKMPYTSDSCELKIKNYSLTYSLSVSIPFILVSVAFFIGLMSENQIDMGRELP